MQELRSQLFPEGWLRAQVLQQLRKQQERNDLLFFQLVKGSR